VQADFILILSPDKAFCLWMQTKTFIYAPGTWMDLTSLIFEK
jgi:hypothetical protein